MDLASSDSQIRILERKALEGDQAAIHALALRAQVMNDPHSDCIAPGTSVVPCGARNMRNWHLNVIEKIGSGAMDGMQFTLLQRASRQAIEVLRVEGFARGDGLLFLQVNGKEFYESER
jgi:3-deoxy-D-arabino-heptulosonate 7-phosphate (DAHP) synthase